VVENYVRNIGRTELAQNPMSEGRKGLKGTMAKNRADGKAKIPGFMYRSLVGICRGPRAGARTMETDRPTRASLLILDSIRALPVTHVSRDHAVRTPECP
jgi:hypothetical protein